MELNGVDRMKTSGPAQGSRSQMSRAPGVPGSTNAHWLTDGSQLEASWPGSLGFWGWLGPMYWRGTWVGAVIRSVPR